MASSAPTTAPSPGGESATPTVAHHPIYGSCLCQNIRYQIRFPTPGSWPPKRNACHCPQCRHQTGTLVLHMLTIPIENIAISDAGATLREYASSPGVRRGFCGTCGSAMFWTKDGEGEIDVFVGTLDEKVLKEEGDVLAVPADGVIWAGDAIEGVTDFKIAGEGERFRKGRDSEKI